MHNDNEQLISLVCGENIGSTWLNLVDIVLSRGALDFDEGRERIYLRSVVIRSLTQLFPDIFIEKYGKKENIDAMIDLMFHNKEMYDFDVVPSFSHGGQSYYARIKNWKMIDFVVNRLAIIPESKKAVMSFIRKEDYEHFIRSFPYSQLQAVKRGNVFEIESGWIDIVSPRNFDAIEFIHRCIEEN